MSGKETQQGNYKLPGENTAGESVAVPSSEAAVEEYDDGTATDSPAVFSPGNL